MIYEILFWVGLIGVSALAFLGLGGHGHMHTQSHNAHAPASHQGHLNHPGHMNQLGARTGGLMLSLMSPITAFSICLGVGAGGLLLRSLPVFSPERIGLAVLSGAIFYGVVVRPLQRLIFRFASNPATALEGAIAQRAEAVSHFDSAGKGLVRLTVDEQLVRILAYLDSDDSPEAGEVQPGDLLTVVSIDGRTNTCRVARI